MIERPDLDNVWSLARLARAACATLLSIALVVALPACGGGDSSDGADGDAGVVLDDALTVACGNGALAIERLQRPGKGPTEVGAFLRGYDLPAGTRLP